MFSIKINGHPFNSDTPILTGKSILELANLLPVEDYELLIKIEQREFEPIQLDEEVDLTQPGIEKFWVRPYKDFKIFIDDEPYHVQDCFMTPIELLNVVNYQPDDYYLKQIMGHKEITYKNDIEHRVSIKNNQRFSTCKLAPTTVS